MTTRGDFFAPKFPFHSINWLRILSTPHRCPESAKQIQGHSSHVSIPSNRVPIFPPRTYLYLCLFLLPHPPPVTSVQLPVVTIILLISQPPVWISSGILITVDLLLPWSNLLMFFRCTFHLMKVAFTPTTRTTTSRSSPRTTTLTGRPEAVGTKVGPLHFR